MKNNLPQSINVGAEHYNQHIGKISPLAFSLGGVTESDFPTFVYSAYEALRDNSCTPPYNSAVAQFHGLSHDEVKSKIRIQNSKLDAISRPFPSDNETLTTMAFMEGTAVHEKSLHTLYSRQIDIAFRLDTFLKITGKARGISPIKTIETRDILSAVAGQRLIDQVLTITPDKKHTPKIRPTNTFKYVNADQSIHYFKQLMHQWDMVAMDIRDEKLSHALLSIGYFGYCRQELIEPEFSFFQSSTIQNGTMPGDDAGIIAGMMANISQEYGSTKNAIGTGICNFMSNAFYEHANQISARTSFDLAPATPTP